MTLQVSELECHHVQGQPIQRHYRNGPAQQRRREKRAAARKLAEEAATQNAEQVTDIEVEDASIEVDDSAVEATVPKGVAPKTTIDTTNDDTNPTTAEEAHPCEVCERTFATLKGLRAHKGKQHKVTSSPIPQIDGSSDFLHEPTYCKICEECHHEIKTSEDLNYHIMNNHKVTEVFEAYGHDWVEERRYCIRRGSPFDVFFRPH